MLRIMIGNSMEPAMPFISFINIKKQNSYAVGDIVAFRSNALLSFCHRIVKIDNTVFTTKGDNRNVSNKYEIDVPIKNIQGKIKEEGK